MFVISESLLYGLAPDVTRRRGYDYYKNGAVKKAFFADDKIYAIVKGERDYQVVLYFSGKTLSNAACNCPAFSQYEGACKHIMAVLYYIKENNENRKKASDYSLRRVLFPKVDVENEVLNELLSSDISENKQQVNVDYEIEFTTNLGGNFIALLHMKMGLDRMYIMRNFGEFMDKFMKKKPYEFGKLFTFNPLLHDFAEEDRRVIEVIKEIYRLEETVDSATYDSKVFMSGKNLNLDMYYLKKVASALGKKDFSLILHQNTISAHFEDGIPFSVVMEKSEDGISLKGEDCSNCIPLDKNCNFILKDNNVYIIDEQDPAYPIIKGLYAKKSGNLNFQGERAKKLFCLLPRLEKSPHIKIGESLNSLYIKKPMKIQMHIDKFRKGISLGLKFMYGDKQVDPFDEKNDSGYLIIREYDKEQHVLKLLSDSGFIRKKNLFCIEDDDKLYTFIKDVVPHLAEMGDIFYSSAVKHLFSLKVPKIRPSIKSIGGNLLELNVDMAGIDEKTAEEILKSIREKKQYFKLKSGEFLSLEDDNVKKLSSILNDVSRDDLKGNAVTLSKYRMMGILGKFRGDAPLSIENIDSLEKVVDDIINSKNQSIELPEGLNGNLREYQVTGYKWLKVLQKNSLGGILADDMGLGKTLQAITFLLSAKEFEEKPGPSLVVAPSTLVYNWENEIKKFAPSLKTLVVTGNKSTRAQLIKAIPEYDVVITSYPLIRNDIELYEPNRFYSLILDEAQHIKNPESLNAKTVKKIRSKARFALTGTPMENSPAELWSIFDFIMPGYLHTYKKFNENYQKPILEGDEDSLQELRKLIAPFILRRTKKDVLKELPEKIESTLMVELTSQQKKIYMSYLMKFKGELEQRIEQEGFEKSKMHIFSALLRLRQICCHPGVFIENYKGESAKMELLKELLEELISGGHRVLLFSQFTSILDLIKKMLRKIGITFAYMDGSTVVSERKKIVDDFNSGKSDVFLLSLKAGGVGLNLTSADTVIHFDPWWNPAVEDQASDRAYRIGQQKNVQVFRLITKGTIEEKIDELQRRKKDLVGSIITEGEVFINSLTREEVMELFKAGAV